MILLIMKAPLKFRTFFVYMMLKCYQADESALRNALYLAIDVYNNRLQNEELATNPLQHYDVAGNANESDMNVEQIAGVKEEIED